MSKIPKIIETIKYKDVPSDVKERAIGEIMEIANSRKLSRCRNDSFFITDSIDWAITWCETPSGSDFWHLIHNAPNLPRPRQKKFRFMES